MSGSTRSRQKRKLEPISIEELAGTTGMSGFCTFLTRDNSVGVPALDQLESPPPAPEASAPVSISSAPNTTAPQPGRTPQAAAPQAAAPEPNAPESRTSETSAPVPTAPDWLRSSPISPALSLTDAAELSAPVLDSSESSAPVFRRKPRIREARTVHEGHSLAEHAVYEAMYQAGKPYQGETRILTIGLRTLAEISRMAYSNCKANVRSLVVKLAIDERPGFSYTDGRTYLVYGLQEILRRRKTAGLTHVVRTRGVAFVDPHTGVPLPIHYADQSGALVSAAPVTGANTNSSASETSDSSAPEQIAAILRRYIAEVDTATAADLWHRCRENASDASVEEVAHFIALKAGRPGFRMPLGFLLSAVPKCFQGDSLGIFRLETQDSTASRERQFAVKLLQSPEADEEQRQWARDLLANPSQ